MALIQIVPPPAGPPPPPGLPIDKGIIILILVALLYGIICIKKKVLFLNFNFSISSFFKNLIRPNKSFSN